MAHNTYEADQPSPEFSCLGNISQCHSSECEGSASVMFLWLSTFFHYHIDSQEVFTLCEEGVSIYSQVVSDSRSFPSLTFIAKLQSQFSSLSRMS